MNCEIFQQIRGILERNPEWRITFMSLPLGRGLDYDCLGIEIHQPKRVTGEESKTYLVAISKIELTWARFDTVKYHLEKAEQDMLS
jgi:hypothetical protein